MATHDQDVSLIRCSICFDSKEGRQPRALLCLHSFCQECLKEWYEKRHREGHCSRTQVECPTCRTISVLPSGDISNLPIDINVQQIADFIKKKSNLFSCQICKLEKGNSLCLMCSVILCENCGEKHKQSPLFSSHELSRNICELHGAALQGVCTTCMCGVCIHCANEDVHKDHSMEEMSTGIKKIKRQVTKCSKELQELIIRGNLDITEKRKYIKLFQCKEDVKRSLDLIKKEVERLEKEIEEHERLCEAKIDAIFEEYKTGSKKASAVILNWNQLLEDDEAGVLDKLKSTDVPNEEMCKLIRGSLSSVPDLNAISFSYCLLENSQNALEALKTCKLACGIPDVRTISDTPAPPVLIATINCGAGCDIQNPHRLCGTSEGDVIVCNSSGGPVYKVHKDCTKTLLYADGMATCEHDGDVYVICTDGGTVTQIKQDGVTVNYKLEPPISKPKGIAVSGDNVFILSSQNITKQSLFDVNCRQMFNIENTNELGHLLKICHEGNTNLVITDWKNKRVLIYDEAGGVLTCFGDFGIQEHLLSGPGGMSRRNNGHLLVADTWNDRIVEYDMDGKFLREVLTDRLRGPEDIVFRYPYLWIAENSYTGKSLKLFKFCD